MLKGSHAIERKISTDYVSILNFMTMNITDIVVRSVTERLLLKLLDKE